MKKKHIPSRTCIGCRTVKEKKELIRVVKTPEGTVEIDKTGKKSGRGAYICSSLDCLYTAVKKKQLEKALRSQINQEIKESLERELNAESY